jgi:arginyl-tRNA synthetase
VNIQVLLSDKVSQALIAAGAPADCEAQVRQSAKAQFGDYQANGVMSVAKKLGMPPRQLAEKVVQLLDLGDVASKVENRRSRLYQYLPEQRLGRAAN